MLWPWRRRAPDAPAPAQASDMNIKDGSVLAFGAKPSFELTPIRPAPKIEDPFKPAPPPPGSDIDPMALDAAFTGSLQDFDTHHEGIGFFGFPYLAELAQRPEYRRMSETLAKEMTREWVQLVSTGDEGDEDSFAKQAKDIRERFAEIVGDPDAEEERDDLKAQWASLIDDQLADDNPKSEKLKAILAEMKRLKVQDAFRRMAEQDGFFGRGQLYLDTGATEKPAELQTPLTIDKRKIKKGAFKRLIAVEPLWSYPGFYNSTDPLKADFYKPSTWFVMGKTVHKTRLLTFVGREVPDILKPAYAFGGLSLSQMAKPYVDNWLRTRQSVSDLLHSFNVPVIKTDMRAILSGGDADTLANRAELINNSRDNRGILLLHKGSGDADVAEEFEQVAAPLGGLHELQAQSQEQMAAVAGTPLVKLLGITPSGLNASSDGEIRSFYDFIAAFQEQLYRSNLETIIKVIQLSLYGEVDEEIGFEFEPLWQLDEAAQAAARKADAETDWGYMDRGAISQVEVRRKIASDRKGPYASLDVEKLPEAQPEEAGDPEPAEGGAEEPEGAMSSGGKGEPRV